MQYKISTKENKMTVKISGDIDQHAADQLRQGVEACIKKERPALLVLDMSGVGFMDSSGFGFVMGRYKTMAALDGRVSVVGCRERIIKLLKMSGTDRYVDIEGRKK